MPDSVEANFTGSDSHLEHCEWSPPQYGPQHAITVYVLDHLTYFGAAVFSMLSPSGAALVVPFQLELQTTAVGICWRHREHCSGRVVSNSHIVCSKMNISSVRS